MFNIFIVTSIASVLVGCYILLSWKLMLKGRKNFKGAKKRRKKVLPLVYSKKHGDKYC